MVHWKKILVPKLRNMPVTVAEVKLILVIFKLSSGR